MAPSKYVGVDGCKGGWFSVGLEQNGNFCESIVFEKFGQLLEHYKDAELILVDMPIGLPDGPDERECDPQARGKLKKHLKPSVFRVPTRHTIDHIAREQGTHASASDVERKYAKRRGPPESVGISKQAFNISPKIAEVDKALLNLSPSPTPQVKEVHPELCFWAMSGGKTLKSKKTLKGKTVRLSILQAVDYRATKIFEKACSRVCNSDDKDVGKIDVGLDDILDALAAAVTAYKGHTQGRFKHCPKAKTRRKTPRSCRWRWFTGSTIRKLKIGRL